jgi:hypothetical protein
MPEILSFQEALHLVPGAKKPHLLMGNGFSRALRNGIFAYDAIFNQADFGKLSAKAKRSFEVLDSTDFERVIKALQDARLLVQLYESKNRALANRLRKDAEGLKEVLVKAIASNHPGLPSDISDVAYKNSKAFLGYFDHLYTLNYDLLLYWTLMQNEILPDVKCDDGFRTPEDGSTKYVSWDPDQSYSQNVHYLHGALHLFDAGSEIHKYTWANTGVPLIQQVRDALEMNYYPLFVSEGESEKKIEKIQHSAYLAKGFRSFVNIQGILFTYGWSFSDSDDHILRAISKGKIQLLAASIYGDVDLPQNQTIVQKLSTIAAARPDKKRLTVVYYDAASARVWG